MTQQNTQGKLQVIKASAGSGKTFTLAKIYIERLLWDMNGNLRKQKNYHEHILAITFTKKATDEMKQRIVERLDELSQGKCKDYQDEFLKKYPNTKPDQLKQAARKALEEILFDYTTFNVSTIDAFFQSVIRVFAHELDRDDFDVQLDSDYVSKVAVNRFLASLSDHFRSKNASKASMVKKYIEDNISDKVRENKEAIFFGGNSVSKILKFSQEIYKESFIEHSADIKEYLSDIGSGKGESRLTKFNKALSEKEKNILQYCEDFNSKLKDFLTEIKLDINSLKKNSQIYKMANGDTKFHKLSSYNTLKKYVSEGNGLSQCTTKGKSNIAEANNAQFGELLKEALNNRQLLITIKEIKAKMYLMVLLNQISEYIEEYRSNNNTVLISDTNDLIAQVLASGVPFLYERTGTRIEHFLIDEFQDTSHKQYANFKPLLADSLSQGRANLIIGDEKQSIYRFRNSDPNLLHHQIEQDFGDEYNDSIPLNTNYRSHKNVVEFNNAFFTSIGTNSEREKISETYSNVKQKVCKSQSENAVEGHVRINVVSDKKNKEDEKPRYGKEYMLSILPDYILHLHNDLKYPFGKILILASRHTDGDAVIECLLKHNMEHPDRRIEIISAESLKLYNSPSVRLIISVLQFLNNTIFHDNEEDGSDTIDESTLSWAEQAKRKQLKKQFLNKVIHDFGKNLGDAGSDANPSEVLKKTMRDNDALKNSTADEQINEYTDIINTLMPDPYEETTGLESLVDRIIKQYIENSGALESGAETTFLLAFQNVVCEFCNQRNSGGSIHEFLKFWNNKKDKLSVESNSNADAVEVMTIHAAKGLERSCVIIPFVNWTMRKDDDTVWLPRENWLNDNNTKMPFLDISTDENGENIVPPIIPFSDKSLTECEIFSSVQNARNDDQTIDNINKTYVAFTRAGQSLHLFAFCSEKEDSNKIGNILCDFAKNDNHFETHHWNENHPDDIIDTDPIDYYEWGKEEEYDCEEKPDENPAEEMPMPKYHVSNNTGALKVNLEDFLIDDDRDCGIRLHRIFSRIRWKRDADRAINYAIKRRILNTDKHPFWTLERLKQVVSDMFTNPDTAEWFANDNKVYNECCIYHHDSNHESKISRPNRVVIRPDGTTIVIDYKFGDAPDEKQRKSYENQVQRYMRLISEAGLPNIKGYVWYVKENTITEVGFK